MLLLALTVILPDSCQTVRNGKDLLGNLSDLASDVRNETCRTWKAYTRHAWPHDNLRPVSGGYADLNGQDPGNFDLQVVGEFSVGSQVGTLRAVPVQIDPDEKAIFVSYSADKEIDPFIEMFYPPTDNLKFAVFSLDGRLIWKKEFSTCTINGIWFTPIYPFDLNGDGFHEFACAQGEQSDRKVYALSGNVIGYLGENAFIAMASKFMDLPGEQLLCYYPDGWVRIWADRNAKDSRIAVHRYNTPYYKNAQSLTATGYNLINLGGL